MTHEEKVACQRIIAEVNATAQASIAVCKRLANAAEARAKQAERERDEARRQGDALEAELVRYAESLNGALADVKRLRKALQAIRDMEPDPVDMALPDHSGCEECKSYEGHPVSHGHCDAWWRAYYQRQKAIEFADSAQRIRMRDIARAALAPQPDQPHLTCQRCQQPMAATEGDVRPTLCEACLAEPAQPAEPAP